MKVSNSSLVTYVKKSPNYTTIKNKRNTHIVIHHMAGKLSVQQCGNIFAQRDRYASSNYGVCGDQVGLYVDEKHRSWCTSNREIDSKAVTIEVSNSTLSPKWEVSDRSLNTVIELCADICKRNNIKKLTWTGDKSGNLHIHKWYAPTSCCGPYLEKKMSYIADEVNKRLSAKKYDVKDAGKTFKVTANKLNLHTKANKNSKTIMQMKKNDEVVLTGWHYPHWYKVIYKGKKGWASKKYLKQI